MVILTVMKQPIDLVIVDAIRMIVEASEGKVTYDVDSNVDDPMFGKKNAVKKTIVKIIITDQI